MTIWYFYILLAPLGLLSMVFLLILALLVGGVYAAIRIAEMSKDDLDK